MSFDRVERLIGSRNLELLAQKRVGIVGLGSGGGFVALSLAMSGVGKFVLIDDDTLEDGNVVRHVADLRDDRASEDRSGRRLDPPAQPESRSRVRMSGASKTTWTRSTSWICWSSASTARTPSTSSIRRASTAA